MASGAGWAEDAGLIEVGEQDPARLARPDLPLCLQIDCWVHARAMVVLEKGQHSEVEVEGGQYPLGEDLRPEPQARDGGFEFHPRTYRGVSFGALSRSL